MAMLEVKDLQTSFFTPAGEVKAVNGISFNLDSGKVLGSHKGIIHYTIGQRKGLGIALGKPAFVIDKNCQDNKVVLGDEEHLFKKQVIVTDVNF